MRVWLYGVVWALGYVGGSIVPDNVGASLVVAGTAVLSGVIMGVYDARKGVA